jgi:hypothetical protein
MHVNGKLRLLNKLILEIRYAHGYTYLDRCGAMINSLGDHGWIVHGAAQPKGTSLLSVADRSTLTVTSTNLSVALEHQYGKAALTTDDLDAFANRAARAFEIVARTLDLSEFLRIGFRSWHFFGCDSAGEAESWIDRLNLSGPTDAFKSMLGETDIIEAQQFVFVVASADRKYRISAGGVEADAVIDLEDHGILPYKPRQLSKDQRKAFQAQAALKRRSQHNPQYAACIDIDAFLEDPRLIDPEHFVTSSFERNEELLEKMGGGKNK